MCSFFFYYMVCTINHYYYLLYTLCRVRVVMIGIKPTVKTRKTVSVEEDQNQAKEAGRGA